MSAWSVSFEREMLRAQTARRAGNEGRARVCARRAAGILINEFLLRQGVTPPSVSVPDLLRLLAASPAASPAVQEITAHLLLRVGENYTLPPGIDLLDDVRQLAILLSLSA